MTPVDTSPSEPVTPALGTVLRRLRRGRGLAQRDLLQPLHLGSHSAIVDYEAGRRIPPEAVIDAYERFFNLAPGSLVRLREHALAQRAEQEARLEEDARVTVGAGAADSGEIGAESRKPPHLLPSAIEHFTGRTGELTHLDRLLRGTVAAAPVVISAVSGMGGIGKTTLAVHWAHQARDSFPDGELYIDLQGFHPSGRPVAAEDAIGRFLIALGVPEDRMPAALEGRTALYRTLLADRSMLVLLDNARDAEQVRPLLPASPQCKVLITSRSRLSGLAVREGVQRISLDILSLRDAVRLLRRTIGERATAEPGATAALAELCARHPLSLRIAAERIASDESTTITDAVGQLSSATNRLNALAVEDDDTAAIRVVFSWSYQTLPSPARRLFRLLGLHDGPDLGLAACAAMAGLGLDECADVISLLLDSNLAEEHAPGRYRLHDLLRLFAHECALAQEPDASRAEAVERLTLWYLHSACAARVSLDPHLPPLEPPSADLSAPPLGFDDEAAALAWCELERPNLTAVALAAPGYDLYEAGWKLPTALYPFFDWRKHFADWIATHKSGAECAHLAGDPEAEGKVLCNLGSAYRPMRRFDEAVDCYQRAHALFRQVGWRTGEGKVLGNLAATYADANRTQEAIAAGLAALELFKELGDEWGQTLCLTNLGNAYVTLGEYDQALHSQRLALEFFRRLSDERGAARAVKGIGTALARLGRPTEALPHLSEAIQAFADAGDQHEQGHALVDLAETYRALNEPAQAARCLREATALFEELGEHWMVAELKPRLG